MSRLSRIVPIFLVVALALWGAGCAVMGPRGVTHTRPLRISDKLSEGDATRRASMRLVVEGLDADAAGLSARALSSYERAIQVDSTNPYAFLALARFDAEGEQPERSLALLDQAEVLLQSEGELIPGVQLHLRGLRGWVMWKQTGAPESAATLDEVAAASPEVWGDGQLSSRELR